MPGTVNTTHSYPTVSPILHIHTPRWVQYYTFIPHGESNTTHSHHAVSPMRHIHTTRWVQCDTFIPRGESNWKEQRSQLPVFPQNKSPHDVKVYSKKKPGAYFWEEGSKAGIALLCVARICCMYMYGGKRTRQIYAAFSVLLTCRLWNTNIQNGWYLLNIQLFSPWDHAK